jgi:hypothetical protein
MHAAIQREAAINEQIRPELRPFVGYHPHAYRHTASQLSEASGRWWEASHPNTASSAYEPGLYAGAVLDHAPREDQLRALYGDRTGPQFAELLAGRAIEGNWEQLFNDLGAQKVPDFDHWRTVMELKVAAERQREMHRRRLRELLDPKHPVSDQDVRDALLKVGRLNHDTDVLQEQIAELDRLLARLRQDRSCWKVVPDTELPPPWPDFDHAERRIRGLAAAEPDPAPVAPERVRDWLTVAEFAECFSVDRATVFRWCAGQALPADPARRPWERTLAPVDTSLGNRYRRIAIDHIAAGFWRGTIVRDRVAKRLSTWPDKKGWLIHAEPGPRCHAELVLPPPFATR